ncbi:putative T7SS-secreted protein [Streptomyces shaanxiensis]|uniref:Type IV secretion protein Rhs n=1 Tax=Streptomyces shaanxiensis TaxID=653357 RepID=A0ABP7UBS6_9ACTN
MGLGDFIDDAAGAAKDGLAAVGDGIEWAGDKTADGLDSVGLDGAAEGVRDASEWSADKLGADVAERQLGQTEDPKEIIHGDVEKLTDRAEHLRDFFKAFDRLGTGMKGLDVHGWQGQAGDAFRAEFEPQPKFWLSAADACEEAAKALVEYASMVEWAQGQAKEAVAIFKRAKAASDKAVADYNAKADEWNRKNEAGQDPGPRPAPFEDPGKAGLDLAQNMVDEARRQRNDAAVRAKDCMMGLVRQAPEPPGGWDLVKSMGRDMAEGMALNSIHLAGGALKAVGETVGLVRMLNPTDPYNLTHPGQYLQNVNGVLTGLASTVAHPERLVGIVKNQNWRDPAEALGSIAIDLIGGKGAGGTIKGGLKGGLKTAGKEAIEQGAKEAARKSVKERLGDLARELNCKVLRNEPVDMATGRMVLAQTDITLPGILPLEFTRTFESAYRNGGWFGPAWASTIDERLEIDAEGVIHVAADGSVRAYPHPAPGLPVTPVQGIEWSLERHPDGSYELTDPVTRITRAFEPPADTEPGGDGVARLASISDRLGNRISVAWDLGQPLSLTHSGGYELHFTCDAGRITRLSLATPDGPVRLRTYAYSDRGFLTSVADSEDRATRYQVDERGRIVAWTDSNGRSFSYTYDDEDRCVHHEGEAGHLRARFEYGLDSREPECTTTRVTDSLGHTSLFTVDSRLRIVAETDRAGRTTRTTYDDQHRPLTVTDPLGATTSYTYDDLGRLLSVTRPDDTTASLTYDEDGNPVETQEPDGAVTRRTYDEAGRLAVTVRPDGTTIALAYDERGHLAAVTDPLGRTSRIESNAAGLPLRVTDPLGATTAYLRDAFGRPVTVTDPLGNTTHMSWTVDGKPARRTGPDGAVESWEWDGEGNLIRHTDPVGGTTEYTYTHFDLLEARTEPDGTRHEFHYDTELRLRQVTNPQGLTWSYEYDPSGLVTAERDFDGRLLNYAHDEAGRLRRRANPMGQTVSYERDLHGRVTVKNADGDETRYTYDPVGSLIAAATPESELVLQRDRMGRLRTEMHEGRILTFDRDALGRPVRRITPSGAVTSYAYDAAGNRVGLRIDGHTLDSAFDAAGRETRRHVDTALTQANRWDPAGRLLARTVTTDGVTGDPHAAPHRQGDAVLQELAYEYRADGCLTAVTDRLNGARRFRLDRAGRVTQVTGQNWTETYTYDTAGNLTQAAWPASHGESAHGDRQFNGTRLQKAGRWTYVHDDAGRVIERRKTRLSRKPDVWRYTWDAEDHLTTCTTPDGTTWRYRYDPLGRRTAKQRLDAGGKVAEETVFTWDGIQVVEQTTTTSAGTSPIALTWDYDGLAPVAQAERALDPETQQAVDARFFAIVTDLVGTPTELVTPGGDLAWRTRSTLWGTTAVARGATAHTPLRHPGQYADPETGLNYNLYRHYDPATARYTSPDPLGLAPAPNPVAWVHNPHTWADPSGLAGCEVVYGKTAGEGENLKRWAKVGDDDWQFNTGHGYDRVHTGPGGVKNDVRSTGLSADQVEAAIARDVYDFIKGGGSVPQPGPGIRPLEGAVDIDGHSIGYRVAQTPDGTYRVATYWLNP